jgi:HSP20 family protein
MLPGFLPSFRSGGTTERGLGGDPFFALQREVNRLFDDVLRSFAAPAPASQGGPGIGNFMMPRMDASETDNEIRLKVEMPGVDPKDVEVDVDEDGVLTIRGEKKVEHRDERENAHIAERAFGVFQRSLRLPFKVDPNQVQARFENGVLTVVLPKPKGQERSGRIRVESGGRQGADGSQAGQGTQNVDGQGASKGSAANAA